MRHVTIGLLIALVGCQANEPSPDVLTDDAETSATDRVVTYDRLVNADQEPENWLMYSGEYNGQRYSRLDQVNRANVGDLKVEWVHQKFHTLSVVETSPVVVDGLMFITSRAIVMGATSRARKPRGFGSIPTYLAVEILNLNDGSGETNAEIR